MEINILPTRKFFEQDISYIKRNIPPECNLVIPESYTETDLLRYAPITDIFLGSLISKDLCKAAPNLKFIQVPWTGVDNLDFKTIQEIGVTVCNSHSNAYAVAEHAVALMFASAKKISFHDSELRKGNWNRPKPDGSNELSPFSKRISNSKVGIIGFGHIGKTIRDYLEGFKCQFHVVDETVKNKNIVENTTFYSPEETDVVLPILDYVFICVPLTERTRGFINTNFFQNLNDTAILINVSRGEVIDEDALFSALKSKKIAGAGIDTWYNYPKNPNEETFPSTKNPFHELNNITLSPHRSAFIEGELPHLDDVIVNINRAVEGLEPINVISPKRKF